MQQHVAAGFQMNRIRVFDLVVADAVLARHEDHRGRRDAREIHRVVARTADHVHRRQPERARAGADLLDQRRIERLRRKVHDRLDVDPHPGRRAVVGACRTQFRIHRRQRRVVGRAQVDGQRHAAGNHVARIRVHVDPADRAASVRRMRTRDAVHRTHEIGCDQQRVAPQFHRRRARMRLHSVDGHVVPALSERPLDHADRRVMRFQHRPLLDMRFEIRADRMRAVPVVGTARIADRGQRIAHRHAIAVALRERMVERERAREHAGTHHHRHEARPFLVGPDGHLERRARAHPGFIERTQHLEAGQHAVVAVELAASGLRVDMAARRHGRQVVPFARAPRKDIADRIDAHRATDVLRPCDEQVARVAIEFGEREAAHAALVGRADPREPHQAVPQPRAIDAQAGRRDARSQILYLHRCHSSH